MLRNFLALVLLSTLLGTAAFAEDDEFKDAPAIDEEGEMCDRRITYEWLLRSDNKFLKDAQKKAVKEGKMVAKFIEQKNGYEMGYIFKKAEEFDSELVSGVFSSSNEHAGKDGLGEYLLKSEIREEEDNANPFKVYIEQKGASDEAGSRYLVENTVKKVRIKDNDEDETNDKFTYIQNTALLKSTNDDYSPRWMDAYVRTVPMEKGVFVIACNYIVPRANLNSIVQTFYTGEAATRLKDTAKNLMAWVKRIHEDKDKDKAKGYRDRLTALIEYAEEKDKEKDKDKDKEKEKNPAPKEATY